MRGQDLSTRITKCIVWRTTRSLLGALGALPSMIWRRSWETTSSGGIPSGVLERGVPWGSVSGADSGVLLLSVAARVEGPSSSHAVREDPAVPACPSSFSGWEPSSLVAGNGTGVCGGTAEAFFGALANSHPWDFAKHRPQAGCCRSHRTFALVHWRHAFCLDGAFSPATHRFRCLTKDDPRAVGDTLTVIPFRRMETQRGLLWVKRLKQRVQVGDCSDGAMVPEYGVASAARPSRWRNASAFSAY